MKSIKKIKILESATIKQALKTLSAGALQILVVLDKKKKFVGTLTDGDIRRGFLKGLSINSSINSIVFRNPIVAKKNTTKEMLLSIAFKKKKYQIPIVDDNRRVIGIYILDELLKNNVMSNEVVIMAGGKGTRLRPFTKDIPKPMLKVGNKPIIQTIVERFKDSGYQNFIICVNYKSKVIKDYFGNGSKFGVNIQYVHEKVKMGTAGALSLIKKKPKKPFFVINGDLLTNLNFKKMLDFHNEHSAKATMCIKEYNINLSYGEVKVASENIVSINEKPKHKFFINAGAYILDPKCIKLIPKKFYDMPSVFKKMIKKKYKIVSFPLGEYWLDVGRPDDYDKAKLEYNSIFHN